MANEEPLGAKTYDQKLDETPGEFHDLRLVMKRLGALEVPDSNFGFGNNHKNDFVRGLSGVSADRVARLLSTWKPPEPNKQQKAA